MKVALELYGDSIETEVYFAVPSPLGVPPSEQRTKAIPLVVADPEDACSPLSSKHLAGMNCIDVMAHYDCMSAAPIKQNIQDKGRPGSSVCTPSLCRACERDVVTLVQVPRCWSSEAAAHSQRRRRLLMLHEQLHLLFTTMMKVSMPANCQSNLLCFPHLVYKRGLTSDTAI